MKILTASLLAVSLLAAVGLAHAAPPNCTIKLKGDDRMQFDLKTATVSASCASIKIELTHTGKLPVQAMGHNVVVGAGKDVASIASDGIKAGAASAYVLKGDKRVLAATKLVGGGGKTSTTLSGKRLVVGGDYVFFCSFPGHPGMMKGKLVVTR